MEFYCVIEQYFLILRYLPEKCCLNWLYFLIRVDPIRAHSFLKWISRSMNLFSCSVYKSCTFCRDASMMSMRRKIAGLRPDQIKQLPKEELDLPVTVQDFEEAMAKCNKSVSKEDLDKYEKWMNEFGSTWCFFLR